MSLLLALFLGLVQGITEFFPVSSSGHLKLFQTLFGLQDLEQYILFDLVCHLGTLVAIVVVLRKEIIEILLTKRFTMLLLMLGILPLFPLLLLLKPIGDVYNTPHFLGYCFLFTALLLFLGERVGHPRPESSRLRRCFDALCIGTFQAVAILPGISRSGATLSGARMMGWEKAESARFIFLLAIPTILGGVVLKTAELMMGKAPIAPVPWGGYVIGFVVSAFTGLIALKGMIRLVQKGKVAPFMWYCALLGLLTLWLI